MSAVDRFIRDAKATPEGFVAALVDPAYWIQCGLTRNWPRYRSETTWEPFWTLFYASLRDGRTIEHSLRLVEQRAVELEAYRPRDVLPEMMDPRGDELTIDPDATLIEQIDRFIEDMKRDCP